MEPSEREAMIAETAAAIIGPAEHTRMSVTAAAGVPDERANRLWRAMGFPEADPDALVFTEQDLAALRTAAALVEYGIVDDDGLVVLARSMAQAVSRLAVSHAAIAVDHLVRVAAEDPAAAEPYVEELVPSVGALLGYVWRRHLVAAAETAVVTLLGEAAADAPVAVGFADLVGFTELSRQADAAALAALVEAFEDAAVRVVTGGGGRVVKTLGDEVLFTVADARAAAGIALGLAEAVAALGQEVRVGVAYGSVLARLGDVFGPTVNIASRLTGLAYPGTVLLDREAAAALRGDPAYDVAPLRRQAVRGYGHLAPFRVRRASRS